ncbi:TraR/DksA family transcriptional regulator [Schumannella soli]|uniref:Molecular chaperone DnaK n=1 Tax=Schumannella soli TaxID=2590779 RepID=A0A506Y6Q9_9MICO|nr:TraR/DksA C4-type zinc finger protein [Schumannella soli]TPW77732.1 molecular chaperone DnaK [Schumannella soli]
MDARALIADRRAVVREKRDAVERELVSIRAARGEWTDEEHDPEGFTLTHEWSRLEGSRAELETELAELDAADARVASGAYGVCARCGQPIPEAQLERRPARTLCVACADRVARR